MAALHRCSQLSHLSSAQSSTIGLCASTSSGRLYSGSRSALGQRRRSPNLTPLASIFKSSATAASNPVRRFSTLSPMRCESVIVAAATAAPHSNNSSSDMGSSSGERATSEVEFEVGGAFGISDVGLIGLAVMGQNLALNIAEKGIPISVYNRSNSKTLACVSRAEKELPSSEDNALLLTGYDSLEDFVASIKRPRKIIILVKAGAPVDATIASLQQYLEPGDVIIDGGNEWYENTERRQALLKSDEAKPLMYMGMGVSGGEEGARNGPSMMPGGEFEAYKLVEPILKKVAAKASGSGTDDGVCVTYIGPGGAGNFVKMVHNGIEYGDMQLIAETYDILKKIGGLSNEELSQTFEDWNKGELESFLVEISAKIFAFKDDQPNLSGTGSSASGGEYLIDKILDKTGMKGTGKWTVQQAADLSVAAPTIASSLDARFISGLKDERMLAADLYASLSSDESIPPPPKLTSTEKSSLIADVRSALYASKICSYAQGMALLRAKSDQMGWDLNLAEMARIWKGGCIIRANFLDDIKGAFIKNPKLANLLVDEYFARALLDRQQGWRRVVSLAINSGCVAAPSMLASLAYFDAYRNRTLPANLVQAQRDYFGSHTYQRVDDASGSWHHSVWSETNSADSITTSGYTN